LTAPAGTFSYKPDGAHHARRSGEIIDARLGQLTRLSELAGRLPGRRPDSIAGVLAKLPELSADARTKLADDPFFHASCIGLMISLRTRDPGAAGRHLTWLAAAIALPAAQLITEPLILAVPNSGSVGFGAVGTRLQLEPELAGRVLRLTGAPDGGIEWEVEDGGSGVLRADDAMCTTVPSVAGAAFDGSDSRLPGMLGESCFAIDRTRPVCATADLALQLSGGLDLLRDSWPEMSAEISADVRLIVPMMSERNAAFTNTAWQGAIFLRGDFRDELFLIERLVHESSHLRLNAEMLVTPMHTHAWDEGVSSPFRAGQRPVTGLIHGIFVFTRAAEALLTVTRDTSDEGVGASRARALLDKVEIALQTVRTQVRLTDSGRRLIDDVARQHRLLTAQCGSATPLAAHASYVEEEM
jgi:HEXXH motif-containing protein